MAPLERMVSLSLWGWVVLSVVFIFTGIVLSNWFLSRELRGVIPLYFGALLGASFVPLAYVLAFWLSKPQYYVNPLALFLLLWIGVLASVLILLGKISLAKPKDWVYQGIVFSSYPDFKKWRRKFLLSLAIPLLLVILTLFLLAGPFLVSPLQVFQDLSHTLQRFLLGIFVLPVLLILWELFLMVMP